MVVHTFRMSTWKVEGGKCLCMRPALSTESSKATMEWTHGEPINKQR